VKVISFLPVEETTRLPLVTDACSACSLDSITASSNIATTTTAAAAATTTATATTT